MRVVFLFRNFGIVSSADKIIYGNVKIVGNFYELVYAGLAFSCFISADGILICIKVKCQL